MAGKFIIAAVAVVALLVQSATAATYTVRDNMGWGVPGGGAADYVTWASTITFRVDDILVFNFGTGAHDVARVTKDNFDSCNTNGPITLQTVGPATVTLNATGEYNFICTFGRHCLNGQKLSINVTTASATPPPVPVTPSPPPAPVTPSPLPAPATPSPPPAPSTPSPPPAPSTPSPPPAPATPSPPPAPATPSPPPSPATPTPPPASDTPSPPPTLSSPPPAPGSPEIPTSPPPPTTSSPPPSSTPAPPTNVIPPPPPSSAPRSLAVFGFVCTLLAFVMGLTM